MAVQPVLLSPLVDELTGFEQVSELFTSYITMDGIDHEENAV